MKLHDTFGDIDIYLFDQLLKGRIRTGRSHSGRRLRLGPQSHFLPQAGFRRLCG